MPKPVTFLCAEDSVPLERGSSPSPINHQIWNCGLQGHTTFQLETAQGLWVLVLIYKTK